MKSLKINPTPPSLPGLVWRALTRGDLAALVELAVECHSVDGGLSFMNEPDTVSDRYFPDSPGAAIGTFSSDEKLVACATVHLTREADTMCTTIVGQVRPDLRNRGIGTYLMHWSQIKAQALFTSTSEEKWLLQVATESLTEAADRLYRAHGFECVFESLVMRRDLRLPLPEQSLPNDVTLTNWGTDLAEQFYQAYQAAFRDRPGFPGWNAAEWIAQVLENDFKPAWSYLACEGDVSLGFVIGNIDLTSNPAGGFVWQIGVIPGHRRQGLGSALLIETMRQMQAAGATLAQLTVNINNPGAIQTYEKLGFETVGRRARYERSAEG